MSVLVHILMFLFSALVIWFFSGRLIHTVEGLATRFNKSGFIVAFFILGFLTSIGEISVGVNATIDKVPQISAGNLIGASFVLILLVIPATAVIGGGIRLKNTLSKSNLLLSLICISLPALFVVDGNVTFNEGLVALIVYITLLFAIRNQPYSLKKVEKINKSVVHKKRSWHIFFKIVVGALLIFLAGRMLVEQSVYFASLLNIPKSVVGLVLLSIGTNIPELVIALQSILTGKKSIAFGDYLGSAATNTPIFAFLALVNGPFTVAVNEFIITSILLVTGLIGFYIFARSKHTLSRKEGLILLLFYAVFLFVQIGNVV